MIKCRNVTDAYYTLKNLVRDEGKYQNSRNGLVRALPYPIMVEFAEPTERFLLDSSRRANPFFHLMESLWMLGGGKDVATMAKYNANMAKYSDDGMYFNAAYGDRWMNHFGYDQVDKAVEMLRANPDDRRVVITMWDPEMDLGSSSKDIPCNQQCMFRIVDGSLNMLTTNRSNDLIWGLCGANAFHLTVLQEYTAAAVGVEMGTWTHVSNNLHIYDQHFHLMDLDTPNSSVPMYPSPMVYEDPEEFRGDCILLCNGDNSFQTHFFNQNVAPVMAIWGLYKEGKLDSALATCEAIKSTDLKIACTVWLMGVKK